MSPAIKLWHFSTVLSRLNLTHPPLSVPQNRIPSDGRITLGAEYTLSIPHFSLHQYTRGDV